MAMETKPEREAGGRRLLALAAELGSVSEACRRLGVDRSTYYRVRRAWGLRTGPEGNKNGEKSAEVGKRVFGLCLRYPEWGCDRLAHYLTLTGLPVSSPTVQKVLIRAGLGRREQREAEAAKPGAGGSG